MPKTKETAPVVVETPEEREEMESQVEEYLLTYEEWAELMKRLEPFSLVTNEVDTLNKYLGHNWGVDYDYVHEDKIIVATVFFSMKGTNPNGFGLPLLSRRGFAPVNGKSQEAFEKAKRQAFRSALVSFGFEVEFESEPLREEAAQTNGRVEEVALTTAAAPPPQTNGAKKYEDIFCGDCSKKLETYKSSKGNTIYPNIQARMTREQYGVALCKECSNVRYKKSRN